MISRPDGTEYGLPFGHYIDQVPEEDLETHLERKLAELRELLGGLTEEQSLYRYAEGKWTIREVLGHMADTERIMSYRLLRLSRGDRTPLPGFDENAFTAAAGFNRFALPELLDDFALVRRSTLSLFGLVGADGWPQRGTVSGKEISARALAYVIAGHALHHTEVLRSRYLSGLGSAQV